MGRGGAQDETGIIEAHHASLQEDEQVFQSFEAESSVEPSHGSEDRAGPGMKCLSRK